MFIGKWNPSVILTYAGMVSAVAGMYFSFEGGMENAFTCLIISGVCDLFDGRIARKIKRTEEEKLFGVEMDSLADMVSFGVFPILLLMGMGFRHPAFLLLYGFFGICTVARLAWFNASAKEEGSPAYYRGLPATYAALILPAAYLGRFLLPGAAFRLAFPAVLFLTGLLYILDIKVPKPRKAAYVFFGLLAVVMIFVYQRILQ